jgi:hypothetical protein
MPSKGRISLRHGIARWPGCEAHIDVYRSRRTFASPQDFLQVFRDCYKLLHR